MTRELPLQREEPSTYWACKHEFTASPAYKRVDQAASGARLNRLLSAFPLHSVVAKMLCPIVIYGILAIQCLAVVG